jgi:hypothetical protein
MAISSQDRDRDQSGKNHPPVERLAKAKSKAKAVRKSKVKHRSGRKKMMDSV